MRYKIVIFLAFFMATSVAGLAQSKADRICGLYYVEDPETGEGSQIQIYKTSNGLYEGKVVWMQYPNLPDGKPRRDVKNPDPQKRNQTNVGIVIVKGFVYDASDDEWENGSIYNPTSGKTYRCFMKFESDNKLKVRGYLGVSLLGKTIIWTKETNLRK
ncbi:MAG: DUF2147 domain-containing protein [Bacteroidales bacterium]|jgi:uncharacterized protein (DUF2147 family)|nr:DUF2147 domain-containing protein [Bacteroidales bacterium]